jgi:hypothetical protein
MAKRHFGGSPTVQKSAGSRKTGKNHEKVNQKLIKKWSKTIKKGAKSLQENDILGVKKAWSRVSKSAKKCHFSSWGGSKTSKTVKSQKTDSKKYNQKLSPKTKIIGF